MLLCFFVKQKTAYDMLISDWSSDVCSSDLRAVQLRRGGLEAAGAHHGVETLQVVQGEGAHAGLIVSDIYKECATFVIASRAGRNYDLSHAHQPRNCHERSEERLVGQEWVSQFRSRWSPFQ